MYQQLTSNHWLIAARALLLAVVLSCQLPTMAEGEGIQLLFADGTSQIFLMEDKPFATFKGDTLIMKSRTQEVYISLINNGVVKAIFIDNEPFIPVHIQESNNACQPVFHLSSFGLDATGLESGKKICLYDLKGVLIATAFVANDGRAKLPINGRGIFIVKTSVSTFKIKK